MCFIALGQYTRRPVLAKTSESWFLAKLSCGYDVVRNLFAASVGRSRWFLHAHSMVLSFCSAYSSIFTVAKKVVLYARLHERPLLAVVLIECQDRRLIVLFRL